MFEVCAADNRVMDRSSRRRQRRGVAWRGVAWRGVAWETGARKVVETGAGAAIAPGTAAVALTIEVFLAATGTAAAPAFWASTAVAVRIALFVSALLIRPTTFGAGGCACRIAALSCLLVRLEWAGVAPWQTSAANTTRAVAVSVRSINFKMASSYS
jgi:hypothetical protein